MGPRYSDEVISAREGNGTVSTGKCPRGRQSLGLQSAAVCGERAGLSRKGHEPEGKRMKENIQQNKRRARWCELWLAYLRAEWRRWRWRRPGRLCRASDEPSSAYIYQFQSVAYMKTYRKKKKIVWKREGGTERNSHIANEISKWKIQSMSFHNLFNTRCFLFRSWEYHVYYEEYIFFFAAAPLFGCLFFLMFCRRSFCVVSFSSSAAVTAVGCLGLERQRIAGWWSERSHSTCRYSKRILCRAKCNSYRKYIFSVNDVCVCVCVCHMDYMRNGNESWTFCKCRPLSIWIAGNSGNHRNP